MTILTKTTWTAGRVFTAAEEMSTSIKINSLEITGVTTGEKIKDGDVIYRAWTTNDAASAWITFTNSFSPAPISNTVITV